MLSQGGRGGRAAEQDDDEFQPEERQDQEEVSHVQTVCLGGQERGMTLYTLQTLLKSHEAWDRSGVIRTAQLSHTQNCVVGSELHFLIL